MAQVRFYHLKRDQSACAVDSVWLFAGGNQSLTWYPYLGRLLVEPRCTLGTLLVFGLSPLPPDTSDYFRGRGTGCRRNISTVVVVVGALWKPGGLSWPTSVFSEVIVLLQVLSGKSSCLDPLAWINRCFPGHRNHLKVVQELSVAPSPGRAGRPTLE